MRRFALLAALVVALSAADRLHTPPALATTYPAGWNLVSGPAGATVSGALGPLYTLQPGDTSYETVPNTTPLATCVGYWAYFPSGGTVTTAPGSPSCSVTPPPGQWVMVGNPSPATTLLVSGADIVYT
jgi:hypothetical protein